MIHVFPDLLVELRVADEALVLGVDVLDDFLDFHLVEQLLLFEFFSEFLVRQIAISTRIELPVALEELGILKKEMVIHFLKRHAQIIACSFGLSVVMLAIRFACCCPEESWFWFFLLFRLRQSRQPIRLLIVSFPKGELWRRPIVLSVDSSQELVFCFSDSAKPKRGRCVSIRSKSTHK